MSNIEFLQSYPAFAPFMDVGITAEKDTDGHTITASTNWKCQKPGTGILWMR